MVEFNRRGFLISLFGTAAVVAAGPFPKILETLPELDFKKIFLDAMPNPNEVYCNGKDYAFATLEWLQEPPYFRVSVPEGYRPMRAESDQIEREIIARLYKEFS